MNQFSSIVSTRFSIYNSLFLNLPFQNISRTGNFLPLLQQACEQGFEAGLQPDEIMSKFFDDYLPGSSSKEKFDFLFRVIQYIERQVVLFDSIEDSSFEQINDVRGKGSVAALLLRADADGRRQALRESVEDFSVRVVLTAHPTQFYPGHVLAILTDLEIAIRQNDFQQINLLLQQLGKTGFINQEKPTPFDEAVSLCWYLENIFYQAAPAIVEQFMKGLSIPLDEWKNDRLISIGFWPGGDRDGNPFVTTEITLKVAQRLRQGILRNYYQDVRQLKRRFTFEGVEPLIQGIEKKLYGALYTNDGYTHSSELLNDLQATRKILIERHGSLFLDLLEEFILKVQLFGFHFTSLDIRQDGRKHEPVVRAILAKGGKEKDVFDQASDQKKIEQLLKFTPDESALKVDDAVAAETISSFSAIRFIQNQNGPQGCHRYIISNCQSAFHIMQVYQMAQWLVADKSTLPLDIVPLFETIDDLAHAQKIMETVYQIPAYRKHLESRNNKQTIMLGFSDGTKDGGYLRANWSIFRAKESLTDISRKFGITALFFDGRGGPPARGGGNTHDFYASLGDSIENSEVQITIQGQTISSNFGKEASCQYNLEQLLSAGLEGRVFGHPSSQLSNDDKALLDQLAEAGYKSYLDLKLDPKFVPYLEKITPLPYFGDTNIGSRPVKRSSGEGLKFEDLRAIPFVGSWAQMKQNIPGFYGVGSALKELKDKGRWNELQALYQQSLFFRTLVGNSMMSLTKSFYPATAYLAKDEEFGAFWKKMFAEYELSRKMILELANMPELMENNSQIRESIKLREKIVLPLIMLQQFALMNLRSGNDKENEQLYRKLIIRCMFGIINAARNSA
ncbi:MAG: phosphoenolpyruvate carboxylase [Cyclobacteriaceae bacterium]|nr:phosphoenolpyruvate carboxylase [Cyclobacteriaceae bacterium]